MSLFGYKKKTKPALWKIRQDEINANLPSQPAEKKWLGKKPKAKRRVRPISAKKQKSDRIYRALLVTWNQKPENKHCRVAMKVYGLMMDAGCNHHLRGRLGTLKFDTRFFCPVSYANSIWPHQNIEKARELGLIAASGDWHKAPDDEITAKIKEMMIEKGIW